MRAKETLLPPGFRRAVDSFGWLVVAAVVSMYLVAKYDITIQERRPSGTKGAAAAATDVARAELLPVVGRPHDSARTTSREDLSPQERVPAATGLGLPAVAGDAGAEYTRLATAAQKASGAELLSVDRRLEAAERALPSDYRFTYERARLAVYGRAEHHEAFYHLRRAAEKAIATERAPEMLERLEEDGRPHGRLRRLAVGHVEWTLLHEALEHGDRHRLWHERESRHSAHTPMRKVATQREQTVAAAGPMQHSERASSAWMRASSLLESGEPCGALVVLQQARAGPEVEEMSRYARARCLRGPGS